MARKIRDTKVRLVLENWSQLMLRKNDLREEELKAALDYEVKNHKRKEFIVRLHQRYCTVRARREREELLTKCK